MPIYEYECKKCKVKKDIMKKINDDNIIYCDICKNSPLKRLISKSSFVLKGHGWYETDFKKKKNNK